MSGREQRIAAALAVVAGAAVWLAWVTYAAFIATITLEGENCTDADRSTCTEADPVYGGLQAALALVGTFLAVRALRRGGRFVVAGDGGRAARSSGLLVLGIFAAWAALVGARIAAAGHPW